MKRTHVREEVRKMRFEEAYAGWNWGRLSQEEAAELLGLCARGFRRYVVRYEADGEAGLLDRRLGHRFTRGALADEVLALREQYRERYVGWNVKHFYGNYQSEGGKRGYTWVKKQLRTGGLVERGKRKGGHRKKRDREPLPGMMIHQDGSRHGWLPGQWHDLIVTMDDATAEVYSMFLVEEEGTASSLAGMREVIESRGLPGSFYGDRGSHYWHTPQAGGKVDKSNPTQFGRAMRQLNIQMIAAYSPQARGRSERQFKTLQDRLPKELALRGIIPFINCLCREDEPQTVL
jgi:transposase InsO family protein